jgi:hypothetical protein
MSTLRPVAYCRKTNDDVGGIPEHPQWALRWLHNTAAPDQSLSNFLSS